MTDSRDLNLLNDFAIHVVQRCSRFVEVTASIYVLNTDFENAILKVAHRALLLPRLSVSFLIVFKNLKQFYSSSRREFKADKKILIVSGEFLPKRYIARDEKN